MTDRSQLATFPSIYARSRRFSIGLPRAVSILTNEESRPDRLLFLRSQSGADPVLCLWTLTLDTGEERLLVDPRKLTDGDAHLSAAERARRERARELSAGIVSYVLDDQQTKAVFTHSGDVFVLDLCAPAGTAPTSLLVRRPAFDPRISPDGKLVAYVAGNDLRLIHLETGLDAPVLESGDAAISFGRADFIAAEEMGRARGFWWSPDSKTLLTTRVDERPVDQWWIADPAHPGRQANPVRYPAAGTPNAQVDLYVVDATAIANGDGGSPRKVSWDEADHYEYLANVLWPAESNPILVRQTRDQRTVSLASFPPDGELTATEQYRITDDTWVELSASSPTICAVGTLTIEDLLEPQNGDPASSGRGPGRRALVLDGAPVTGDGIAVRSIEAVIDDHALITAWTVPSEIHLFLIPLGETSTADGGLRGVRPPIQLTSEPGVHSVLTVFASESTDLGSAEPDTTPLIAMSVATSDQERTRYQLVPLLDDLGELQLGDPVASIENRMETSQLQAIPLFHPLGADRLESAVFFPRDATGDEPLPVLLDPYGGPHAQRALKNYTPHLVSQWFADHGFVVIVTDGRGTPGRGPRWEREVWGDLASVVLEDQLAALDAAAQDFDVLDLSRVGIRGWSFGGYLAALAVLRRPDRFHAAIAGAPVTTWRLYDTHYTERYLGHPDHYPHHYEQTDLIAEAANLEQPLLLIHGLADDNVVAAHSLRLSTALLSTGRPHQVLPLSGVTHMAAQESVTENMLWLQLKFLQQHLQPPAESPSAGPGPAPEPVVTSTPAGQLADPAR